MNDPEVAKSEGFQGPPPAAALENDLAKRLNDSGDDFRILLDLLPICLMYLPGAKKSFMPTPDWSACWDMKARKS